MTLKGKAMQCNVDRKNLSDVKNSTESHVSMYVRRAQGTSHCAHNTLEG